MKMKYQKPMAAVEHYKLSQSIAACGIIIGLVDNMCVISDNDTPVQLRSFAYSDPAYFSNGPCAKDYMTIQDTDTLCVHTQAAAIFTSI